MNIECSFRVESDIDNSRFYLCAIEWESTILFHRKKAWLVFSVGINISVMYYLRIEFGCSASIAVPTVHIQSSHIHSANIILNAAQPNIIKLCHYFEYSSVNYCKSSCFVLIISVPVSFVLFVFFYQTYRVRCVRITLNIVKCTATHCFLTTSRKNQTFS